MLKMSIKYRLMIAFLVILILPCSAIGWSSYQNAKSQITEQIEQNASISVDFTNNQIKDIMASSLSNIDYLGKNLNADLSAPEIRKVFETFLEINAEFENVHFATHNRAMYTLPELKLAADFDPSKRPWFIKAMESKGKAVVNDAIASADGSGNVVVIQSKTSDDGSGIVGATLKLSKMAEQVKNIKVGQKGYVIIMDKDQKIIIHPTEKPGSKSESESTAKFYEKASGTVDVNFNGEQKKAVFVTNPDTGWKIIGIVDVSEITEATRGIFLTTIAVIAVAMALGILLVFWIVRSITTPLRELMNSTEEIADGNLTEEIVIRSNDELGQLSVSVNQMVHKLRGLIGGVIDSSERVTAASEQISATTQEIAGGNASQAEAAQNMQELFNELSVAINSVAESAEEAAEMASKTTGIAHEGGDIVKKSITGMTQVSSQMTRLEEDSNKIGDIIEVIDDIAEQTNLLALNAAIEAARAGEQGRGFAVVADEVRKLAERSGDATKQITAIIKGMQENTRKSVMAVSEGVNHSEETGKAFERIIEMINETERKVGEIAVACEEQAAQSNEVMHSIENISSATEQAAAASEETAATAQSLSQLAEGLNESVSIFKIK
ncbi:MULTISPECIES: methyl-accepting chemotaxis protein [unclassified Paenibacillus]|uniref:methyl-accepting chemotaxis protein n=1 Tax=unclassified Paenibacillus TaxID=185978 RepID=UPI001AE3B93D|nr:MULTISPECIES: methyl-accepting chemotaxis protein [unclassified Paenibacillus]MBP1157318.1 methyl-accepting chemotaxis protein [Paenibacillus sp. PvP091]MBP1171943.1 methyl-accepting chemotaxis protein [Paenibacillus sp. PvR098]MBP2438324.1 methyl-accepting chemotaxis protein [Paenibacillus sp. PvP052]